MALGGQLAGNPLPYQQPVFYYYGHDSSHSWFAISNGTAIIHKDTAV